MPGRGPAFIPSGPRIQNVSMGSPPPSLAESPPPSGPDKYVRKRNLAAKWKRRIRSRLKVVKEIYKELGRSRPFKTVSLTYLALASLYHLALWFIPQLNEFIQKLPAVRTLLSGKSWAILGLLVLLVFVVEGTFRIKRSKLKQQGKRHQDDITALKEKVETLSGDISELKKRLEPFLTISFDPNKERCKQYFPRREITQYRVCVTSPVPLNDAELVANRVTIGALTHDGLHLQPRHDREERGTKRVILKPFKPEAWDVVSEHSPHGVALTCIKALGVMGFGDGLHEFELMATGGDSFPATKIVNMEVRDGRLVTFEVKDGRLSDLPV